jgi:hypothetical protein
VQDHFGCRDDAVAPKQGGGENDEDVLLISINMFCLSL